jgi:UDP-3-O-[3-hydroxymyristoyl] glucosamine N-acyltransferase
VLFPNVVLYQDITVGAGCILHSGVVLGADGFAFVWTGQKQQKIPQVGKVAIADNVEIGANTCVDRAMCGVTSIGQGTKLDNLIQIGHNTTVGENTVIAAAAGVSGSCKIGSRNTIAGQVAFSDHSSTCDDVILGGRTGVTGDIKKPGAYLGLPVRPYQEAVKALALATRLPDMLSRIRALEAKIRELEKGS